jgi:hypothetical protein
MEDGAGGHRGGYLIASRDDHLNAGSVTSKESAGPEEILRDQHLFQGFEKNSHD